MKVKCNLTQLGTINNEPVYGISFPDTEPASRLARRVSDMCGGAGRSCFSQATVTSMWGSSFAVPTVRMSRGTGTGEMSQQTWFVLVNKTGKPVGLFGPDGGTNGRWEILDFTGQVLDSGHRSSLGFFPDDV